jgi:hypothetical protein
MSARLGASITARPKRDAATAAPVRALIFSRSTTGEATATKTGVR